MQKHLLILADASDKSAPRFYEEALALGFTVELIHYRDLIRKADPVPKIHVPKHTALLARYPSVGGDYSKSFQALLCILLKEYEFAAVHYKELYKQNYLEYNDKLFQAYVFKKLGIAHPKIIPTVQKDSFPIVAKKRLSSSGRGNFLLQTETEYERFIAKYDESEFLFQKYYLLAGDYRVLLYEGEIIAIAQRKVSIKEDGRITVHTIQAAILPETVIQSCQRIAITMNMDFCGVDIGKKKDGSYFFIEANSSPQFLGTERETGVNVGRIVVERFMQHIQ